MTSPSYEDPVVAEIHTIRAQMLAECDGDYRKFMERLREEHEIIAGVVERLPRASPEPRLAPNVPKEPASGWAAGVSFVAAESPDGTWSVIVSFF